MHNHAIKLIRTAYGYMELAFSYIAYGYMELAFSYIKMMWYGITFFLKS
jgi:hypothetical protein